MADELRKFCQKVRLKFKEVYTDIIAKEASKGRTIEASKIVGAIGLSALSFPLTAGVFQSLVLWPLRISSNKRILGTISGVVSVVLSSSVASSVFITYLNSQTLSFKSLKHYREQFDEVFPSVKYSFKPLDITLYIAGSLVIFKALGGRFRAVVPSHFAHPGSFAKVSLPASGKNYASSFVKKELARLGRKYGCHTCGRRKFTKFVGDHMPPNKLVRTGQTQRFYPQCLDCSNSQGAMLSGSSSNSKRRIKLHGTSLRLYHLWLPVPLAVMCLRDYI